MLIIPFKLSEVAVGSKIEYRNIAGVSFKGVFSGFAEQNGEKVFALQDSKTGKVAQLQPGSLVLVLAEPK